MLLCKRILPSLTDVVNAVFDSRDISPRVLGQLFWNYVLDSRFQVPMIAILWDGTAMKG